MLHNYLKGLFVSKMLATLLDQCVIGWATRLFTVLLAACCLSMTATSGYAGNCFVQPVKAVQQFNYGYGYASKVQFVAVQQPYYSMAIAGDYVRAKNATASIEESLARIAENTARIAENQGQPAPTPTPPGPTPDPQPPVNPPPTTPPPGGALDIPALLTTRCASCHSGPESAGGFQLFESDQQTMLRVTAAKAIWIDSVTFDGYMPQNDPKLSDTEYTQLRAWLQQYAPEIRRLARENDR